MFCNPQVRELAGAACGIDTRSDLTVII